MAVKVLERIAEDFQLSFLLLESFLSFRAVAKAEMLALLSLKCLCVAL